MGKPHNRPRFAKLSGQCKGQAMHRPLHGQRPCFATKGPFGLRGSAPGPFHECCAAFLSLPRVSPAWASLTFVPLGPHFSATSLKNSHKAQAPLSPRFPGRVILLKWRNKYGQIDQGYPLCLYLIFAWCPLN